MLEPSSRLDLSVDRASDVPLATQLAWKLRTFVAVGALAPGDRLPGVREVAEAAGVNVNTVRSVYGRLEEEGLVSSQRGRGTFVAQDAAPVAALARIAAAAAADARTAGLDPRDVAAALFVDAHSIAPTSAGDAVEPPPAGAGTDRGGREQRRELRADIARLEGELAYLERLTSAPARPPRRHAGQILPATELEAIREELAQRVTALREQRAEARTSAQARRAAPDEAADSRPAPDSRVWRHGGVWTGLEPGGVVYES